MKARSQKEWKKPWLKWKLLEIVRVDDEIVYRFNLGFRIMQFVLWG